LIVAIDGTTNVVALAAWWSFHQHSCEAPDHAHKGTQHKMRSINEGDLAERLSLQVQQLVLIV
jgi:hypothetical protein